MKRAVMTATFGSRNANEVPDHGAWDEGNNVQGVQCRVERNAWFILPTRTDGTVLRRTGSRPDIAIIVWLPTNIQCPQERLIRSVNAGRQVCPLISIVVSGRLVVIMPNTALSPWSVPSGPRVRVKLVHTLNHAASHVAISICVQSLTIWLC